MGIQCVEVLVVQQLEQRLGVFEWPKDNLISKAIHFAPAQAVKATLARAGGELLPSSFSLTDDVNGGTPCLVNPRCPAVSAHHTGAYSSCLINTLLVEHYPIEDEEYALLSTFPASTQQL